MNHGALVMGTAHYSYSYVPHKEMTATVYIVQLVTS